MSNLAFSYYRYACHVDNMAKESGLYDEYIYVGYPSKAAYNQEAEDSFEIYSQVNEHVDGKLSELKSKGYIEAYYSCYEEGYRMVDNKHHYCTFFPLEFLSDINMETDKGSWFDGEKHQYNAIPVVVGYNLRNLYDIGQVFRIDGINCDLILIGTLKKNEIFISPSGTGNGIDLNLIAQDFDDSVIIGEQFPENSEFVCMASPRIIKTKGSSEKNKEIILDEVADYCDTATFKDMADDAHESSIYLTKMQGILAALSLMVCLVGVSCINLLTAVSEKKTESVYTLCGMNKVYAYAVVGIESIIKGVIPSIAGLIWFYSFVEKNDLQEAYNDEWNWVFTLMIILFLFTISSVYPIKQVSESSPAEVIAAE